jgi:AAA domain
VAEASHNEHATEGVGAAQANGQRPLSFHEQTIWHGSDRDFISQVIEILNRDPYSTLLYDEVACRRYADLKQHNPSVFQSLLKAVRIFATPEGARDWQRALDLRIYSHRHLATVPLSSIDEAEVSWLWEPYVPLRKVTLVEGDPEAGKTFLLLAITSAVTRGGCLPQQDGRVGPPDAARAGNVLYLTAEDGLGDTLRPRARRMEADLDRVFVVPTADLFPMELEPFSLARPQMLSGAIADRDIKLVILDPLTAFLGADVDMHRANEVRPVMTTLVTIAAEHHCAIVALRHWTKMPSGKARYRGQGNIDFTASARSVLAVGESPEDERLRVMAQSKNSIKGRGVSMLFEISDEGFRWAGTSTLTADELSAAQPRLHHHQRKDAMQWLKDYLSDGPHPSEEVIQMAEQVGIKERTLRRAKESLHILSVQELKVWYWRLPKFDARWDRYPGQEDL